MAVFTVKSCNFPDGFGSWARTAWLALCCSGSLWLVMGEAVFAQLEPLPTEMEGYQRFWAMQTPAQRLQLARRDPRPEPTAPSGASLLGDPLTLAEAQQPSQAGAPSISSTVASASASPLATAGIPDASPPPITAPTSSSYSQEQETAPATALTSEELNRQRIQRLLAEGAAAHAQRQAQQATTPPTAGRVQATPNPPAPTLTSTQPPQPTTSQASALRVEEQPWLRSNDGLEPFTPGSSSSETVAVGKPEENASEEEELGRIPSFPETAPLLISQAGGELGLRGMLSQGSPLDPELVENFPLLQKGSPSSIEAEPETEASTETLTSTSGLSLAPELLERFPLLRTLGAEADSPSSDLQAALPPTPDLPGSSSQGSQIRQQLSATATAQRQIPLDPDQINVNGDVLSYIAEEDLGIVEGNALIQLSDGTRITGNRLLFYRRERRLRSDGPFLMEQPPGPQGRGIRQIQGENLDLDIPSRTAQFETSLVILPGEEPGTKVFVRSEETTALLGDQIFFEKATITTSPEPPITHYVQGDRVEVFPDDRVMVYDARMFAGGELTEQGDLQAGTQIAYFPLFVYSLRDHQWILPGQSETEGVFVKSSWAYRFDEYNFGGLRVDAIQKKGLGVGFLHDYILPITDSVNYGRAQFYLVTEADQQRMSSRFRVDHNFNFYAATIFGQAGQLRGQLNLNLDNTYRPAGGRNDNADLRLNSTFQGDLSTTTLNISRTGSQERGTYSFPLTLSHNQRYGGVHWLQSDLRLDYNQRVSIQDGPDFADARLTLGTQLTPPGWGGSYRLNYRAYSSSNGDNEPRRNFELAFNPDLIRITPDISLTNALTLTQEQQPDREVGSGLNFFNRYELRSSLRFNDIQPARWVTVIPGSIDYSQVLYSTPDQESTVSLNPRLSLRPADWNTIDLRYSRTFYGNNSVPFQTLSTSPKDVDRINANISFFTPRDLLPNVPPGYIAFEDDLPGELPIALTFPDDTQEDLEAIATRNLQELQAEVKNLLRLDTTAGYDFINQKWDVVNANFTWNTTPDLFNIQLQTAYDLNEGELRPVRLQYRGRSSTTFNRDQRSGLDVYEPGISYSLQAVYDPKLGEISTYGVDLDATIGTQWQNHWRFRLGLTEEGIRRVEVRRDLRDFELRLAYDPTAEMLRLEGILVAFPSRPVGLTQERGDFLLTTPGGAFSLDDLGR
ncbi:hypothetical protein L1047_04130 [Synechococcus sp. Nb3U1]|uniref:hypothetical protein n=1 Tax=Synechococcus sp. Nb3U1 TaxID=1914529 RepID=UPI001F2795F7|nr:hypothetical protein [Synechococcus sp. Nb3U1]MCF2970383.1 hypothetical protein [Synechococcus sp. Nb3U1]